MADIYIERPEELVRFYAERMVQGFGPNVGRKLGWTIRDAEAAGDRRCTRFWEQVRDAVRAQQAGQA